MAVDTDAHALALAYLRKDLASLDREERGVIDDLLRQDVTSRDAGDIAEEQATFWDRAADRVAAVGGSWPFIFVFAAVLVGWMLLNTEVLERVGLQFDPYPYIFLNLMLSTLAAIQAPIIMMSQNRSTARDRLAARHDYEVNLRAELEIVRLHRRLDEVHREVAAVAAMLRAERG